MGVIEKNRRAAEASKNNRLSVSLKRAPGKIKIHVLAEGSTPKQRLRGEWGLSLLINENILFDTFGHPEILENNIRQYGVDMRKIKKVVISHNHWDHVSGLDFVLVNAKQPAAVYLPQEDMKMYGICRRHGAYVHISGVTGGERDGFYLTGAMNAKLKGDSFMEQGLIMDGKKGLVLVAGCSHPGILKMASRARKLLKKPLYAVVGGLHLKDAGLDRIKKTAAALKKMGIKKIYAGHCTGAAAIAVLKKTFGARFKKIKESDIINI